MSTRSNIAVKINENRWKVIYCHWNGYATHNGKILHEHYNSFDRAKRLVNHGNVSILAERLSPRKGLPHSFENPEKRQDDVCLFYKRDRHEKGEEATEYGRGNGLPLEMFLETYSPDFDIEWVYLWDDGWKVFTYRNPKDIRPLSEVLAMEKPDDWNYIDE